jgi:hypothetical protein
MPENSPAAHHDYVGHGITPLSAAVHTTGGRWSAQPIAVTAPTAFSEFLMKPDELVPADMDVHPVRCRWLAPDCGRIRASTGTSCHPARPGSTWPNAGSGY